MRSTLPADTQQEIIRLYTDEGLSMRAIAERLYWSEGAVRRALIENDVPCRSRGGSFHSLPPEQIDRVIEMYQNGHSQRSIADALGVCPSTVRYRLGRAGVEVRQTSEAQQLSHRERISRDGAAALTGSQRRALEILERATKPMATDRVARRLSLTEHEAYSTLKRLRKLGLVDAKRQAGVRVRRNEWNRTDLALADVLAAGLAPINWSGTWLPITPFRDWLESQVAIERRKAMYLAVTGTKPSTDGSGGMSVEGAVAKQLGMSERRLHALRYTQDYISLSLADRALSQFGSDLRLWDLWPELGDDEEIAPDRFRRRWVRDEHDSELAA